MSIPTNLNYDNLRLSWWIEVLTAHPLCIYYFGPFEHQGEAQASQPGHLADLTGEGAEIIAVSTHFCQPRKLTLDEHEVTLRDLVMGPLTFFDLLSLH